MLQGSANSARYSFSSTRDSLKQKNLLNWFPFPNGTNVLLIGAEVAALAEHFLDTGLKVSLIGSGGAVGVAKSRLNEYKNLTIVKEISQLQPLSFTHIVSMGILPSHMEVSSVGNYFGVISKLLSPAGKIIVAVDNRFALSYWAGNADLQTRRYFDSIENYPYSQSGGSFSKNELQNLCNEAGLKKQLWYYPHPSYRAPSEVFSDDFLPSLGGMSGITASLGSGNREFFFSEALAIRTIIRNGLYPVFANSFLVIAGRSK